MVRRKKIRSFPITHLFPSMATLAGLCAGLSAMRFAMLERWEMAVVLLILAAIIDGIDGRLARMLNATSKFGAELDSLADFVSFGVAPVMVIYIWQLHEIKGLGWLLVLLYVICCALRLARFNSALFQDKDSKDDEEPDDRFVGVPAPVGALLLLTPLAASFEFGSGFFDQPWLIAGYTAIIAAMMVSTIPTLSIKKYKIRQSLAGPFLLLAGVLIAGVILEIWLTYALCALAYLVLMPINFLRFSRDGQSSATEDES